MMPTSSGSVKSHDPPPAGGSGKTSQNTQIPVTFDAVTFNDLQVNRLREMERRIETETKRRKRSWKREIDRMRQEFLELKPVDCDVEPMTSSGQSCVTDEMADLSGMKTTFLDYPDTGRRFKVRFNLNGFNRKSIAVTTDGDTLQVRAIRLDEQEKGKTVERMFVRKVQKPSGVDHAKLKSYLTSDDILIIEAPVAPSSLDLSHVIRRSASVGVGQHHSGAPPLTRCQSASPSNNSGSPGTPSSGTASGKEKYGVPIFREEDGRRRMHMVIDIGTAFQPSDIFVQVMKENKIQVKAKREEKSADRISKNKFSKEYELTEKIDTYSLRGGLQAGGKLVLTAFAKAHKSSLTRANSSTGSTEANPVTSRAELEKSQSDSCVGSPVVTVSDARELPDAMPTSNI